MLDTSYNYQNFSLVTNLNDFYRSGLKEMNNVKAIFGAIKLLFGLSTNRVQLYAAEEARIYKFVFLAPGINRIPLGWFVYMPEEKRLDLYDASVGDQIPFMQWKGKKLAFTTASELQKIAGIVDLFKSVVVVS